MKVDLGSVTGFLGKQRLSSRFFWRFREGKIKPKVVPRQGFKKALIIRIRFICDDGNDVALLYDGFSIFFAYNVIPEWVR